MEERPKEIEFPIEFDRCPACNSEQKLAKRLVREEVAKKRMMPDAKGFISITQTVVADPRTPPSIVPVIVSYFDVCLNCGCYYCVRAEKTTATAQTKIIQPPGRPPAGQFPLGRLPPFMNNPNLS